MKGMDAKEMSICFDNINLESNMSEDVSSDYDTKASEKGVQTFEQGCEDIKFCMKPENNADKNITEDTKSITLPENQIIEAAIKKANVSTSTVKTNRKIIDLSSECVCKTDIEESTEEDMEEIGSSCAEDVSKDIASYDNLGVDDQEITKEQNVDVLSTPCKAKSLLAPDINTLGLDADDLKFCNECAEKYPEFTLYDGTVSFKEFYKTKIKCLKTLLTRYPRLDIIKLETELKDIDTDHFLGNATISPDVIRKKIDDSYRSRARLGNILIQVLGQFYMWNRWCEMLRSKLWSDHQIKGAHNRDGMTATHMPDVEIYVAELNGIKDASERKDMILKAAADSLSRQLSCIQLKEATGFSYLVEEKIELEEMVSGKKEKFRNSAKKGIDLDGYDSFNPGETIKSPTDRGSVATCGYGVPDDDLSTLG